MACLCLSSTSSTRWGQPLGSSDAGRGPRLELKPRGGCRLARCRRRPWTEPPPAAAPTLPPPPRALRPRLPGPRPHSDPQPRPRLRPRPPSAPSSRSSPRLGTWSSTTPCPPPWRPAKILCTAASTLCWTTWKRASRAAGRCVRGGCRRPWWGARRAPPCAPPAPHKAGLKPGAPPLLPPQAACLRSRHALEAPPLPLLQLRGPPPTPAVNTDSRLPHTLPLPACVIPAHPPQPSCLHC
jgi:hypothetical protein